MSAMTRYSRGPFGMQEAPNGEFVKFDSANERELALREELTSANSDKEAYGQNVIGLQMQRKTWRLEQASLTQRVASLRHVGLELTGVIDEYRAMPCGSLKERMFASADRYRKRLNTPKCDGNHGGPRCDDPECWNADATLNPFAGCSLAGGKSHNSLGPKDADGNLVCTCGFAWGLPF